MPWWLCHAICAENEPICPVFLYRNVACFLTLLWFSYLRPNVFSETTKSFETIDFCKFSDSVFKNSFSESFSFLCLKSSMFLEPYQNSSKQSTWAAVVTVVYTTTFSNETLDGLCQCFFCGKPLLHLFFTPYFCSGGEGAQLWKTMNRVFHLVTEQTTIDSYLLFLH